MAKNVEKQALKKAREPMSFEATYAMVKKEYGSNTLALASDLNKVSRIPFGIPELDFQLCGGLPMGRIIHLYGVEHSGKTFLAMVMAAALQKTYPDKMIFWLDLERSFDSIRAAQVGMDLDRTIVCRPASAEVGMEELIEMAPFISGGVVDSVAAVTSAAETDSTMVDKQVGMVAAIMSKFFHKWISDTSPEKLKGAEVPMLLLTNQVRDVIGSYIKCTKTTGGRSMLHYPSIFIEVSKGTLVKMEKVYDAEDEEIVLGHDIKFKIKKNNTFQPDKIGSFMLCTRPYDLGGYQLQVNQTDWPKGLLKYAAHYEVIKKNGSWYEYKGDVFAQGAKAAQARLFNEGEITAEVQAAVLREIRRIHGLKEEEPKHDVKAKRNKAKVAEAGKAVGKKQWRKESAR